MIWPPAASPPLLNTSRSTPGEVRAEPGRRASVCHRPLAFLSVDLSTRRLQLLVGAQSDHQAPAWTHSGHLGEALVCVHGPHQAPDTDTCGVGLSPQRGEQTAGSPARVPVSLYRCSGPPESPALPWGPSRWTTEVTGQVGEGAPASTGPGRAREAAGPGVIWAACLWNSAVPPEPQPVPPHTGGVKSPSARSEFDFEKQPRALIAQPGERRLTEQGTGIWGGKQVRL